MTQVSETKLTATEVLDREFLELRAKLLELGASFDRMDRSPGAVHEDPRWQQLRDALHILLSNSPARAEQIQLHFSRDYEPAWREQFQL